ncbi:hypothetical protein [Natronoarchaeum rubrum]|uniref:hypothetical protein n=1 Tax=Natronoarchaeum rubrum TaxID=755311 RepID=UPI0021137B82|nr:hypothetical protein [Natronoarchaeum rubrum]
MTDTMKDVDHTHPSDEDSVARVFRRGRGVAADGSGRPSDREDEQDDDDESMANVDHQPPNGDGANPVFERGKKREDAVANDVTEDEE